MTDVGNVTDPSEEVSTTSVPKVGLSALRVTVPVEVNPPKTLLGCSVSDNTRAAVIFKSAVAVAPPDAEILAKPVAGTPRVVMVKVAEVCPGSTVTFVGTAAASVSESSETSKPTLGAAPTKVTVPVLTSPANTVVGLRVRDATLVTLTLITVVATSPPPRAIKVTGVLTATGVVVTLNVADVRPAGTMTQTGTVTEGLVTESGTVNPAAGALSEIVTVPTAEKPPTTGFGATLTEEIVWAKTAEMVARIAVNKTPNLKQTREAIRRRVMDLFSGKCQTDSTNYKPIPTLSAHIAAT